MHASAATVCRKVRLPTASMIDRSGQSGKPQTGDAAVTVGDTIPLSEQVVLKQLVLFLQFGAPVRW